MAPELISKNNYTEKVDIWSIGIILFEMINGWPPYLGLSPFKVMHKIVSEPAPKLPDNSGSFYVHDFLNKCLVKDP